MKKIRIFIAAAVILTLTSLSAYAANSGSVNENISWQFNTIDTIGSFGEKTANSSIGIYLWNSFNDMLPLASSKIIKN